MSVIDRLRRRLRVVVHDRHPSDFRVDFVVAGTQKGGTTALYEYLADHPGIVTSGHKEVHFFDREALFETGTPDYRLYHSYFPMAGDGAGVVGESTPIYMYWWPAARRMWEYNREMRVVLLLRSPITRAYSHWNMQRQRGDEDLSFEAAVQKERTRCREALPHQHRFYSYVDRGFYSEQIRRLRHFFPEDQMLVLRTEWLRSEPRAVLERVHAFLGVEPMPDVQPRTVHSRPYESEMEETTKERLKKTYEHEIAELERMLDWDCGDWLSV